MVGKRKLRVGILGTGWVSTIRHIPSFKRDRRAEIVAVFSPEREKAKQIAQRFGIPYYYNDLSSFLTHEMDIVAIGTPPWTHAPLAIEAMRSGKHVLVEKPMAMNLSEATEMSRVARESGVQLCVAHNFLFSSSTQRVASMMAKGDLGTVQHVMGIQFSSPRRRLPNWYPQLPGGLFFDEAPHLIYLLRSFLGRLSVISVDATTQKGQQPIRHLAVNFHGEKGTGYLSMWFEAPISEWLVIVCGTDKVLILDIFRDILISASPDGAHTPQDVLLSSLRINTQLMGGIISSGLRYTTQRLLYGHDLLVHLFIDSILEGKAPPVNPEEGGEVIRIMETILTHVFPERAFK